LEEDDDQVPDDGANDQSCTDEHVDATDLINGDGKAGQAKSVDWGVISI
jgi:hypothetical protein